MNPLLELQNVSYAYHGAKGETQALTDISFSVEKGEFIAIVGPSGCGKSTLLSLICGLISPEKGLLQINGKNPKENPDSIGYMLQHDHLFEWRSVYQNVILGLEIRRSLTPETRKKAQKLLKIYGLEKFSDAKPSALSGGMRQRAALVRTLLLEPELLLLDEPFSALDYQTRLKVGDDIGQILRTQHKTAVLVTHDLGEAISLADRILVCSKQPATIQKIISVQFSDDTLTPLGRRNAPEFKHYFHLIWKELNQNE